MWNGVNQSSFEAQMGYISEIYILMMIIKTKRLRPNMASEPYYINQRVFENQACI